MNRVSLIFCVAAFLVFLAIGVAGYPLAALPREAVVAARTPTPAERLGPIDLGGNFGPVSVLDLVGYYLENPPAAPSSGGAPAKARRFSGC